MHCFPCVTTGHLWNDKLPTAEQRPVPRSGHAMCLVCLRRDGRGTHRRGSSTRRVTERSKHDALQVALGVGRAVKEVNFFCWTAHMKAVLLSVLM